MNLIVDAIGFILSGDTGRLTPVSEALLQHLILTFSAVAIAALIAIPLGWAIGHTGKGRDVAVAIAGAARAVPSFGLLILLVLLLGVLQTTEAGLITFVLLAIPSILAGAYTGFEAIDRKVIDAARSVGMTEWQILWRVEVPLGLSLLVAGLRSATLQVVATVTIAAYVNLGGLGEYIFAGIPLRRFDIVLAGALLVAALALVLDGLFALLQKAAIPAGVRLGHAESRTTSSRRLRRSTPQSPAATSASV